MDSNSYSQSNKPLIGIVVNNQDPLLLRRVQLKIEGLIETDDEDSLPWFRPKTSGAGSRSDYGNFDSVPEVNTTVMVEFADGDILNGVYSAIPDTAVDASQKRLFGEDYPNTYGSCDSKGSFTRVNKKKGYEEQLHHSGVYTKTDKDGNVHIHIPSNLVIHIGGSVLMQVNKNFFMRALEQLGLVAVKELGVSGSDVEVVTDGTFAVDASITDINNGLSFGVTDANESIVPEVIEKADESHTKVVELQKKVQKSGELASQTIQIQKEALLGTRKS